MTKAQEFAEKLSVLGNSPVKYEDYSSLVELFRMAHATNEDQTIQFTRNEVRLIYLSLMTTKARLKEYDPKKGLNQ